MATLVTCRSGPLITPIVGSICELCQNEDDELREAAITTIEAILRKSPSSIHNIEKFIEILKESIQYDPNYCADFDESDDDNEYSEEKTTKTIRMTKMFLGRLDARAQNVMMPLLHLLTLQMTHT